MKAKSIKAKTATAIPSALQQVKGDGFKPTLAIVFLTNVEEIDAITNMLNHEHIAVFGATTSEYFDEKGMEVEGIVVLLLDMQTENFRIALQDYASSSVYACASAIGGVGIQAFDRPAFIICSADIQTPGEEVIRGLLQQAAPDSKIIGGVAGEHIHFTGTLFTNHAKTQSGLLALILDEDKIEVRGTAVSGWKAVGTAKKVTKCNGNWVFTIDGEPALAVIKKFLGTDMLVSTHSDGLDSFPLQFQREGRKPIMRPVIMWNKEDQSVMLGGPVEEGALFHFSLPPDIDVIDEVIQSTTNIRDTQLPEADAVLVFSCVGRLSTLGPMVATELEGLAATWEKPMAGFFSMGEFGKIDEAPPEFHGTTVSWAALKEK